MNTNGNTARTHDAQPAPTPMPWPAPFEVVQKWVLENGYSGATDDVACAAYLKAHPQEEAVARPMETAPRDGTMLRLLVRFTEHATEDAEEAWTIGSNSFDANGEDVWQFAGWCWTHDHFTEGKGTPVGWLPMLGERARVPEGMVLVPREPTPEMIAACIACWQERLNRKAAAGTLLCGGNPERSFRENWAAMLAAATPAPQGVE